MLNILSEYNEMIQILKQWEDERYGGQWQHNTRIISVPEVDTQQMKQKMESKTRQFVWNEKNKSTDCAD
jgi:hypothetical protein